MQATTAPQSTRLEAISPATGALLGVVDATLAADVRGVVAAVAQVQPLWSQLRLADRARYMRRVAQAVIDEFTDLEELLASELGRPRAEVAMTELLPAVEALRWVADDGPGALGVERLSIHRALQPLKRGRVHYEPLGVVAVIGAAGAPLAQPLAQMAQALLGGNGVVFKPSPRASLTGERIGRLLGRAGLPEGLVRIVHGDAEVGRALAAAPVDKVLFTGRPAAGLEVARLCAEEGRACVLEMGGQDAMLVLADANLNRAIDGALWAGFAAAGQARGSVERIFVARELAERFLSGLVDRARELRIGDPLDAAVQVGPLGSARRLAHVQELVGEAVAGGATLRCGGEVEVAGLRGSFYAPAVLVDVEPSMRILHEPVGGPVVSVVEVDSTAEAIERANVTRYGLGASVWTADRYQGRRIARELEVGMVWLNDHLIGPMVPQGPWGGERASGVGRTHGRAGLLECVTPRLVTWDPPTGHAPWWFPYDATVQRAALAVAELRSARDSDRQRGLKSGGAAVMRMIARGVRGARGARRAGGE